MLNRGEQSVQRNEQYLWSHVESGLYGLVSGFLPVPFCSKLFLWSRTTDIIIPPVDPAMLTTAVETRYLDLMTILVFHVHTL